MASITIHSKTHGAVKFVVRDEGIGYVRVYSDKWDGKQPCEGGGFMGSTLMASAESLDKTARRWWKGFLAGRREMAL